MKEKTEAFGRLLKIMDELRENCPWDKKQTIDSLRLLTIEETYELAEAITAGDLQAVKNELGDLILHVVFYARIASEKGDFDIKGVIEGICEKLIHRHPHIYSDVKVSSAKEVKQNWEKLKLKEKGRQSVLEGVPNSLPAMVKAQRVQEKVKAVGFDWEDASGPWEKVHEELAELKREVETGNSRNAETEFGDVLFALINYARFIGVNPEDALARTNRKFMERFNKIEERAKQEGKDLKAMTLQEMDDLWEKAKSRD